MTVGELSNRMSSVELAEWMAYTRHYEALPDSWAETGLLASAILSPYCRRGQTPKPTDFIPTEKAPQHRNQIHEQLEQLKKELGQ